MCTEKFKKVMEETKTYIFKKSTLSDNTPGVKKRIWKSLKQILTAERSLPWKEDFVLCK